MSKRYIDKTKLKELGLVVFERAGHKCEICGCALTIRNRSIHHKIPWNESVEGRYDPNNCQALCLECHRKKH